MCGCEHHRDHNAPCTCTCPGHKAVREEMSRNAPMSATEHTLTAAEHVECACPPPWNNDHSPSPLCPAHHRDWLAAHDAEVARTAAKEAGERIAVAFEGMADVWGGDAMWLTSGRRVAALAADIVREEGRADG